MWWPLIMFLFLQTKVPLSSLVSDGVFSLNTSSYHGQRVASEIKLLQVATRRVFHQLLLQV